MIRKLIEGAYYLSAKHVPIVWFNSPMTQYVFHARAYFDGREEPGFSGWPWRWRLADMPVEE